MNVLLLLLAIDSASIAHVVVAPRESLTVLTTTPSSTSGTSAGTAVVLLPGLLGGAFGFRKLTPELTASGHPTFAIEPLGVGSSSHPDDGDYSLDAQADRVNAVLETFEVKNAVIVGSNFGASVALRLAYRHRSESRPCCSSRGDQSIARPPAARRSHFGLPRYSRSSVRAAWHVAASPTQCVSTPPTRRG